MIKTPLKKKSSKKTAMRIRFSLFMFIFAMLKTKSNFNPIEL